MRVTPFLIRAIATAVAVCIVTAVVGSAIVGWIGQRHANSRLGQIERGIQALTPDVQRRDKEVEELTRP